MSYGEKIAQLRKSKNMTQNELGDKLNVSAQAVSKWEKEISQPDIDTLKNICSIFDVSLNELLEVSATEEKIDAPVSIIGFCKKCGKQLSATDKYKRVNVKKGEFETQEIYCDNCFNKLVADQKQKKAQEEQRKFQYKVEESTKVLIKGFVWGAIAAVLSVIILIIAEQPFYYPILFGVGLFALISQTIWGNWVGDFFFFFCRAFKAPFGFIFTLDLDGIIWLLTVKLALWVLCGILSALLFILGLALSIPLAIFVLPFGIPKAIYQARIGELDD